MTDATPALKACPRELALQRVRETIADAEAMDLLDEPFAWDAEEPPNLTPRDILEALSAVPQEDQVERVARDVSFAWTPGAGAYKHYPQYVNFTGRKLTVRGPEYQIEGGHWQMGPTVSIELPDEAIAELRAALAAIEPVSAPVMREALEDARRVIAEELDCMVECATAPPEHDRATLDPMTKPYVEEYDAVLDKIDAALAASPLSVEITEEMVRRVARAIFDNGATTEWTPEIGERLGKQARAAILAMQSVAALRSSGIDGEPLADRAAGV